MAPQRRASANKRPQQHTSQSTQCGIHRFFSPHTCGGIASTSPAIELDMKPMTPLSGTAAHSKLAVPNGSRLRVPAENQRQRKMLKISPTSLIQPSQDDGVGDQVEWRLSPMADRLHEASTDIAQHPLPVLNSKKSSSLPNVQDLFKNSSSTSCSGPVLMRKKKSPSLAGKLEQWLSASNTAQKSNAGAVKPTSMGAAILLEQSLDWYQQTPNVQEKENIVLAFPSSGPGTDFNTQKSPKGTGNMAQSSLHCHSLAKKTHKRKGKQRASGQRRKALLELLDQVQNVMSDPESSFAEEDTSCLEDRKTVKSVDSCEGKDSAKTSVEIASNNFDNDCKPIAKCSSIPLTKGDICTGFYKKDSSISGGLQKTTHDCVDDKSNVEDAISDHSNLEDEDSAIPQALAGIHFLVLEVADMVDGVDGNTLPKKVLRLLNEYSGLERILYLVDEWYYTVVRPGDTVNVIGDFDVDGKCVIDRDNNLLIVHPDVLISGSKVGSSFSCPRRAVLDERIRSNSVAFPALLGTMIHELFQVALRDRVTSRLVLEQEAESLVHHHIDSLFACGGNEKDALIKLRESIPTILNWLDSFFHASESLRQSRKWTLEGRRVTYLYQSLRW